MYDVFFSRHYVELFEFGNMRQGSPSHSLSFSYMERGVKILLATLSTPQYGFQKRLKEFKETGYKATVKELNKNLIGKNVLDMLTPKSIDHL